MNSTKIDVDIAKTLDIPKNQVVATLKLLTEGNTVPFIARYRKEVTGSLDEDQIREIQKLWEYEVSLHERKEVILGKIEELGKLTDPLKQKILQAKKLSELEDLYLPYKEKRKTRGTVAINQGLEPLATYLLSLPDRGDVIAEAQKYVTTSKGELAVLTAEAALQGAKDIIAEQSSEVAECRRLIRKEYEKYAQVVTKVKKDGKKLDEKGVYEIYYQYAESVRTILPHRVLAINRGEREKVLSVKIDIEEERVLSYVVNPIIGNRGTSPTAPYVREALIDGFRRLTRGAIERDVRSELKQRAEDQAIEVFGDNLRKLLLQPPLKDKTILGIDPAFRTGCKLAVIDPSGKVLDIDVIYPTQKYVGEDIPQSRLVEAEKKIMQKVSSFSVDLIAIGNGTASRETEQFVSELITANSLPIAYIIVNEAGASVYSASALAKKEFPNLQVEERSAASIARRVQDPLAELVKIDPKSLGVGQYQHDVTQTKLKEQLDFVVEKAVNQVGVNVNTASWALLQHVSGISEGLAQKIVEQRDSSGLFTSRDQLKKVPRLGGKTYEQSVGFLRILQGENPLDKTAIHPESYSTTHKLMKLLRVRSEDIGTESMIQAVRKVDIPKVAKELNIGEITLSDICDCLMVPLRDMRDEFPQPLLKKGVLHLEDITPGMELQGTVRNVVDFGAFVDCGVKVDGLVHISKLKNGFVKHPKDVVSVGDIVTVWVEELDIKRQRLSLTMVKE